jgi:predicted GNAT family acetyltransferase
MAYVTDAVVGIYGVGTVPTHRRRGYAHALTAACLAIEPDRPAILQPSAAAASLYRRLDFVDVGPFTHWG